MPAVMPALGATGPSATKMRLAWTRAAGCKRASCPIRLWWVVHWRPSSRPARAASSAPEHTVHSRAEPDASAGPTLRASQAAVSPSHRSRPALGPPAWSATPTTTTQAPCGKRFGNGAMPLSAIGSELGSDLRAPATDSAKAGTAPARPDKRFAIRKGSATPARSSNSTPGVTTTITVVVVGREGAVRVLVQRQCRRELAQPIQRPHQPRRERERALALDVQHPHDRQAAFGEAGDQRVLGR